MFAGILQSIVSTAGGGEEGEKTRAKTHLTTDQTLTKAALMIPLILLSFTRLFAGGTFRDSSLNCSPNQFAVYQTNSSGFVERTIEKSANANRFYMNNYCWEHLTHYKIDDVPLDERISHKNLRNDLKQTDTANLAINKYFPYVMFFLIIIAAIPVMIWTRVAATAVQPQVEFLISGITEAMDITVGTLLELHKDKKLVREKRTTRLGVDGAPVREIVSVERMLELFYEKFSDAEEKEKLMTKFTTLQKFVRAKVTCSKLVTHFLIYRSANILSLVGVTIALYEWSLKNTKSNFNCLVPFSSTDIPEQQQVYELLSCNINGVIVRQYITEIWCLANVFLIVAGILGTIGDFNSAKDSSSLLKITEPICEHKISYEDWTLNGNSWIGLNDLHILLMLAKRNVGAKKVVAMCLRANEMMRYLGEDIEGQNGPYLRQLAGQLLWTNDEKFDEEVDKVLEETEKMRKT